MDYVSVLQGLNWWPVLAAAAASMVLGALWYHEKVFGTVWMKLAGLKKKDVQSSNMAPVFTGMFALSLISMTFLAVIINLIGPSIFTAFDGAVFGMLVGAFIVGTVIGGNYLFEGRTLEFWAINAGYAVLSLTVAGAIIGGWPY